MRSGRVLLLVALSGVLAGCTGAPAATVPTAQPIDPAVDPIDPQGVSGQPGGVGGSVKNSAPSVSSFTQSATNGDNRGSFAVVFSGAVFDPNSENQIERIFIRGTGPANFSSSHAVTVDESKADTAPAAFGPDGWKVWSDAKDDGILQYAYRQTFPAFSATGAYSFTVRVEDKSASGANSTPLAVAIIAFSDVTISATPVDANGAVLTGQNWGQWNAEAGATLVASQNYIRLVNTGDVPTSRIVIDLDPAFRGAEDANFTIPVASNVEFAWFEDATPGATSPSEGNFTFLPANTEGSVTVQFSARNTVIYVTYRILALPAVLPIQSYGIAYTATEL